MSKAQFGGFAVLCFVLMRLAAGFHFYTEGLKKLEPGFSSEGFLRAAKGPLADYFGSFAPGLHGAYVLLDQPRQWDSLTPEQKKSDSEWRGPYTKHLADIAKANELVDKHNAEVKKSGEGEQQEYDIVDAEFPPHAPYRDWAVAIDKAWQQQHDGAMAALKADKATRERADKVYRSAKASLAGYLADNEQAMIEYQHSLSRLDEIKQQVNQEGGTLPYVDDRIASQEREARTTPRPWIDGVQALEDEYHDQLRALVDGEEPASARVLKRLEGALNPPTPLDRINTIVTWVVLGCGVLLFLGLFTRVAAIVAAGFLMSVIATQPPWAFGADTAYLGYQLFEIAGLLALAALGAGQWLGIDGLLGCLCCGCKTKVETTAETIATPTA